MADDGGDKLLVKIAVFGIAMSFMATLMVSVVFVEGNGDYDYDEIQSYRDELISFTGESMLNSTPWVLTAVYTPWVSTDGTDGHIDPDGWLYGQSITDYSYIGKSADIRLDPDQKSAVPITQAESSLTYKYETGYKWWASNFDGDGLSIGGKIAQKLGFNVTETETETANIWNYTGYRYYFDPTLPFNDQSGGGTSTRDGALSLVWYSYNGQEGLSGGLDVYGGNVLLASYSAADIIADYNSSSGYATSYEFNFEGTILNLSIRFDAETINVGVPLMQAWTQGDWSMAISSVSAGNFFDIDSSTSFTTSAGSMIKTFIKIYTFDMPEMGNSVANYILWMLVGLPMTMAILCITLRLVNGFRVI